MRKQGSDPDNNSDDTDTDKDDSTNNTIIVDMYISACTYFDHEIQIRKVQIRKLSENGVKYSRPNI
jgi:hypothetical protein